MRSRTRNLVASIATNITQRFASKKVAVPPGMATLFFVTRDKPAQISPDASPHTVNLQRFHRESVPGLPGRIAKTPSFQKRDPRHTSSIQQKVWGFTCPG